jgi:O-antigen ligase
MLHAVAIALCVAAIAFLFWSDPGRASDERISWVPFVWMFIAGTRFVSSWLDLRTPVGMDTASEGSPIDRLFFLAMIVCGAIVLSRRDVDWRRLFTRNKLLTAYLLYCLCSILWTDDPYVLGKRWIKELANPIVALVLLTERRPFDALATTIKRLSFICLPVSVLFIKYYPQLGRTYAQDGTPSYTGIGEQKNALGLICLCAIVGYAWTQLFRRRTDQPAHLAFHAIFLLMLAWLVNMANSQTALLCAAVAVAFLLLSTRPFARARPTRLIGAVLAATALYLIADATIGVKSHIFAMLGRDESLTNRTTIWGVVSSINTNPLVGVGFMSFWMGDRLTVISRAIGANLNQAHNGYLEQYLNLGYLGVAFILAIAITALLDARKQLASDYASACIRFSLILVALLYNYTEASFYGVNNMWLLFLVAAIDVPPAERETVAMTADAVPIRGRGLNPRAMATPRATRAFERPASRALGGRGAGLRKLSNRQMRQRTVR